MVPHHRRRRIQQSSNMLHNKSMSLQREKISLLLLIRLLYTQHVDNDGKICKIGPGCGTFVLIAPSDLRRARLIDAEEIPSGEGACLGYVRGSILPEKIIANVTTVVCARVEKFVRETLHVLVSNGGQIWPIRRHVVAHMDVADEGAQGGEVGGDRGDRKSVTTEGGDRDHAVVATHRIFFVVRFYVREKVWSPYDIMMVSY